MASPIESLLTQAILTRVACPTPHWGQQSGSAFSIVSTTTSISAAPKQILEVLLFSEEYPRWNKFVPRISIKSSSKVSRPRTLEVGTVFVEHVDMFGQGRPSGLIKMKLEMIKMDSMSNQDVIVDSQGNSHRAKNGYRVVWLGRGIPSWLLRSERVHEIFEDHDTKGLTTYNCFETFSGPLAGLTRLFVGKALVRRFHEWNECLALHAIRS